MKKKLLVFSFIMLTITLLVCYLKIDTKNKEDISSNNNSISDEDFFKIKNKIMLQYGIKSELMIWWDISTYGIMMMNLVNNFKKLGGRNE